MNKPHLTGPLSGKTPGLQEPHKASGGHDIRHLQQYLIVTVQKCFRYVQNILDVDKVLLSDFETREDTR